MNYDKLFNVIMILIINFIVAMPNCKFVTPLYAADVNSNGTAHPQGITSSGLGTTITSAGSTFNITGGTQQGSNLFHSFGKFNLHSGESAVFNDSGITNTIGRITGGEYSWINGKITSDAANLYMLNPSGMLFGPNASLDLAGSFHVSTADYLRMGENDKFFAGPLENEMLSVEAPTAFGFLDKDLEGFQNLQGTISLEGKGGITEQEWNENPTGLRVKEGKTVSLIGGEINMTNGTTYEVQETDNEGNLITEKKHAGDIYAPGGYVHMVSVESAGEVAINEDGADISGFEKSGKISLSDESCVSVNGESGGAVYIRAGKFLLDNYSVVKANSDGSGTGKGIDIKVEDLSLTDGAFLNASAYSSGDAGAIRIKAVNSVRLSGEDSQGNVCKIISNTAGETDSAGDSGTIEIKTENLYLSDGAEIGTTSFGPGNAGNIKIEVNEAINLSGESSSGYLTKIISKAQGETETAGNGGTIEITTNELQVTDGAQITAGTFGPGNGGNIKIQAGSTAALSGENISGDFQSGIYANTDSSDETAGDGGTIELTAEELLLNEGAQITTTSFGDGSGGNIKIQVNGTLSAENPFNSEYSTGIYANTEGESESAGDGGTIEITAKELHLINGAQIAVSSFGGGNSGDIKIHADDAVAVSGESLNASSGILSGTESEEDYAGHSGSIELTSHQLYLEDGGWIGTSSFGPGKCGDIKIQLEDSAYFSGRDSEGYGSGLFSGSWGIMEQAGNGGTIHMAAKDLYLDEFAEITTGSDGDGEAGEIDLNVSFLQLGGEAVISSQSNAEENGGNAGTIRINATDSVRLSGNGKITTQANGAGGGQIFVKADNEIYLFNGNITSSVLNGEGNGGDVQTESAFVILNHGSITANAESGDGGAIFIRTENFIKSTDSAVTATSKRGNDGTVKIEAPDLDITSGLMVLPAGTADAAKWMNFPCTDRSGENASRFVIRGKDASPAPYDDLLPGSLFWLGDDKKNKKREK